MEGEDIKKGAEEEQKQENTVETKKEESKQQEEKSEQKVDTEKIKSDAVSEYLQSLGLDDETLKGVVEKHKQDEEANKTDLQKTQDLLDKTTKKLAQETKLRIEAEAKLSAIKLGAKAELVDDLVVIASSRITKEKSIEEVIAEIKKGETGSVYFDKTGEDQKESGKNLTGGRKQKGIEEDKRQKEETGKDSFMEDLLSSKKRKPKKSSYFQK